MCDKYICMYIYIHVHVSRVFMSQTSTHLYSCKCNHVFHTHKNKIHNAHSTTNMFYTKLFLSV